MLFNSVRLKGTKNSLGAAKRDQENVIKRGRIHRPLSSLRKENELHLTIVDNRLQIRPT